MTKSEIAINKFKGGFNCAQSVFFCFGDKFNIYENMVLKIASGFGGGMGREQEVCGAISGGILVLGALYGRGRNDEKSKQLIEKCYDYVEYAVKIIENIIKGKI